jgi:hypothetical protein
MSKCAWTHTAPTGQCLDLNWTFCLQVPCFVQFPVSRVVYKLSFLWQTWEISAVSEVSRGGLQATY